MLCYFIARLLRRRMENRVERTRGHLDLCTLRQFITRDRSRRHRPQITAVCAERVFQEHSVGVEHLRLYLFKRKWLRLRQRGIARAGLSNLRLDLLELG